MGLLVPEWNSFERWALAQRPVSHSFGYVRAYVVLWMLLLFECNYPIRFMSIRPVPIFIFRTPFALFEPPSRVLRLQYVQARLSTRS